MPVSGIGHQDEFFPEQILVLFHQVIPLVHILHIIYPLEIIQAVSQIHGDIVGLGDFLLFLFLVGGVDEHGEMVFVRIGELQILKVLQGIAIGAFSLVPAGDVEHFHPFGFAIVEKVHCPRGCGQFILFDRLIPHGIIESIMFGGNHGPPVVRMEDQCIIMPKARAIGVINKFLPWYVLFAPLIRC